MIVTEDKVGKYCLNYVLNTSRLFDAKQLVIKAKVASSKIINFLIVENTYFTAFRLSTRRYCVE